MRGVTWALATLVFGVANSLAAQSPQSGAFITRLGRDTVGLERYSRAGSSVSGELLSRAPRTTIRRYETTLGAQGQATRVDVSVYRPGDSSAVQRDVTVIGDEAATVTRHRSSGDTTFAVPLPPGTLATGPGLYALYAEIARRAHPAGRDSVAVTVYVAGTPAPTRFVVRRLGADTLVVASANGAVHARVDSRGRLLGLYAAETTQKVTFDRIASADLSTIAAAWGQGGQLSPRDTARATIAGASITIDYGRPSKRGRVLFGGDVVPWNVVWRTGANAATQLFTDKDLVIGGALIPAGTYTLWTLPNPSGWQLIVNSETGQWGTAYDPAHDFARVPGVVNSLAKPVEQFTIDVLPHGSGGIFQLEWDRLRVTIPFTVK